MHFWNSPAVTIRFCSMYSNSCCSCWCEPEIIKINQSSHKMYSNNTEFSTVYVNFKCPYEKSLETYRMHLISLLNWHFIHLKRQHFEQTPLLNNLVTDLWETILLIDITFKWLLTWSLQQNFHSEYTNKSVEANEFDK